MKDYKKVLLHNKAWAAQKLELDPDFFQHLAEVQAPQYLWIGCADSRVPANEITGTDPGEVFVHRNIANMVVHTDLNMLSVLQYAVEILKVKHIIVCGHYGCGGVKAAMSSNRYGLIDNWLMNIKDVYRMHEEELHNIKDTQERENKLVELNIKEQIFNLSKTTIIQNAWEKDQLPHLHGWVYDLHDGILKDLSLVAPESKIDEIYKFDIY